MMNGRGGRSRTGGPRLPKSRALPTELHPGRFLAQPAIGSDRVKVRARRLACRELVEDESKTPERGTLSCGATPRTLGRPQHVTIGAHEFALIQLCDRDIPRAISHHLADATQFLVARKMIPMHDPDRKHLAAIAAGHAFLECVHPCTRFPCPCAFAD